MAQRRAQLRRRLRSPRSAKEWIKGVISASQPSRRSVRVEQDHEANQGVRGLARRDAAQLRELILKADPDIEEEWKWVKPTNPGVPVWSHDGGVCAGRLQGGRQAHVLSGCFDQRPQEALQLQPRGQRAPRDRRSRRREDQRFGVQSSSFVTRSRRTPKRWPCANPKSGNRRTHMVCLSMHAGFAKRSCTPRARPAMVL